MQKRTTTHAEHPMKKILIGALIFFAIVVAPHKAAAGDDSRRDKPLVVMIFDDNCKTWCKQVRPIIDDLHKSYADDAEFAEIDVTFKNLPDAKKKAKELGIGSLLEDTIGNVPMVLVCEQNRLKFTEFVGAKSKDIYEACLKKILAKRG
jgi:thiol-disulfide isomerase/thioredoxin